MVVRRRICPALSDALKVATVGSHSLHSLNLGECQ